MPLTTRLRPFTDADAKAAPSKPGAYELLFNGTVVYIGSSSRSIRARIMAHRKRKRFIRVTSFRCRTVSWPKDAIVLEAKLCKSFKRANDGIPRLQERTPQNRQFWLW